MSVHIIQRKVYKYSPAAQGSTKKSSLATSVVTGTQRQSFPPLPSEGTGIWEGL